jgi:hypoxanthine phosphoribosyltransferase
MQILLTEQAIQDRVAQLSKEIASFYMDDPWVMIGVLNGAARFMMDLISYLPLESKKRLHYDFVSSKSYYGTYRIPQVALKKTCLVQVYDRPVLIVEDIIDTGHTLSFLQQHIQEQEPISLKTICLLDKPSRREVDITVDYIGFTIPDHFIVGYGLDINDSSRALPYIGIYE